MALKDIVSKAKAVHTVKIHGTDVRFCELGYDAEQVAKAAGREYAKKVPDAKSEEYATLYSFLEMFRKAGEQIDDAEFFGLPADYHQEVVMAVNAYLSDKVHVEGKRLQDELRDRLKAKKLD